MTPRLSLYLDALRFLAASLVVASHFAYPFFSGGDYIALRELSLGRHAVIVFFVLSGFVIAHAAATKEKTAGRFLFHRFTRIYSVALPAVLLTLLVDRAGSHANPQAYAGWWFRGENPIGRATAALTFTNELWFVHLRLGTNGPYWSLTYEAWYYALFCSLTFLGGWARAAVAITICLVMGPKILLLCPAWWLGVWAYRSLTPRGDAPPVLAWSLATLPAAIYVLCLALGVPQDLEALSGMLLGKRFVTERLAFSHEFAWSAFLGAIVALHLVGIGRLFAPDRIEHGAGPAAIRWLAGGTFSLYLVHYPLLHFFAALLPGDVHALGRQAVLLLAVCLSCFAFAALFERTLPAQRAFLERLASGGWTPRSADETADGSSTAARRLPP